MGLSLIFGRLETCASDVLTVSGSKPLVIAAFSNTERASFRLPTAINQRGDSGRNLQNDLIFTVLRHFLPTYHTYNMYKALSPQSVSCNSLQSLRRYAKPPIIEFPIPKGIWYKIGTIVLQTPPTISMHITKEVIIVPPLAIAKKNLNRTKPQNQGDHAEIIPHTDWKNIQKTSVFFLPYRSAVTPKTTFPKMRQAWLILIIKQKCRL